ncbi:MAG: hypothetical protein ABSF52_03480 [Syntrophobacteraceae bacterium]|jgi:hypothetical protein
MAQMQTLKVDFSDMPDAPQVQPKTLSIDFSDIPDALPQAQPEQTPQLPLNPLSGKKILKVDFSDIPDAPPVQRKILRVDFSDIPDAEPSGVAPAEQRKGKPEDSWFWQTLESSDSLKPYAQKVRGYVESPTDTKGAWDWLTSTISKSAAQLGVGLAKTPFDITQTFSGASQAAIEKFLQEHSEYEQIVREDPTGEALQALAGIGAVAGTLKTAEATAKGAAAFIGRPIGIDTENQTWTWESFKDAWVNHPVESFAAVYPFGASFLKGKGITPSETQVKELIDSAVKDEKTPLAQEVKKEMEEGPPKGELDFSEDSADASKSGANLGPLDAEARVAALATLAREFHSTLDRIAQTMRTTAILETDAGRIIAGGGRDLKPIQRALLNEEEFAAKLPRAHAEITALEYAAKNGMRPQALAVTRKICPDCVTAIEQSGGRLTSPTTAIWPKE